MVVSVVGKRRFVMEGNLTGGTARYSRNHVSTVEGRRESI